MCGVPKRLLDDALPSREMKKRCGGMSEDKLIPPPLIAGPELSYGDAGLRSVQDKITGSGPLSLVRKTWSIRAQVKSPRSRRSRISVQPRFR